MEGQQDEPADYLARETSEDHVLVYAPVFGISRPVWERVVREGLAEALVGTCAKEPARLHSGSCMAVLPDLKRAESCATQP